MWVSLHKTPTGPGLPSLPDGNSSCNLITPLRAPASNLFPSPCHKCHHSASQTPLTRTARRNTGTHLGHTSTDGQGQPCFCTAHQGQNKSETQRGPCSWQTWLAEWGGGGPLGRARRPPLSRWLGFRWRPIPTRLASTVDIPWAGLMEPPSNTSRQIPTFPEL